MSVSTESRCLDLLDLAFARHIPQIRAYVHAKPQTGWKSFSTDAVANLRKPQFTPWKPAPSALSKATK
ncbi:hypothetical protein RUA4292_04766 [Ruegeria atlantica]|uniref:Uncharacterized protein n=1 Tax=Ruegeria atlantica TaxID=81569 RepID=A0A0P1EJP3_9RHOB|nr:hypothetical protein RUA4292_04766 [Ruegeria atlantica]